MGREGKVEEELEINSPADKFFKRLSSELHHLPDASPDKVQGAEILEGDWVTPGSVKLWNYTIDGVQEVFKEKVEIDEENKTITMVGLSGHVLEKYKAYMIVYQVFPKGESGTVKLSLIYEKFKETDGEPHNYLKFGINVIKDLEKHLTPKKG
ncbi:MLP-like protein 329 [Syzygium oleosum]|uniref:MLP-like protein 329 n=1 Tax=Syzygium oleosum TaxID=219896 RepID=UPI0011D1D6A4|nr:MLP-like protein 329 [Syzygium oleosum]